MSAGLLDEVEQAKNRKLCDWHSETSFAALAGFVGMWGDVSGSDRWG